MQFVVGALLLIAAWTFAPYVLDRVETGDRLVEAAEPRRDQASALPAQVTPTKTANQRPSQPPATVAPARPPAPPQQPEISEARVVSPPAPDVLSGDANADLVLLLQRELRRVGCYRRRLGSSWSATRPAVVAFLSRINASLPTTQPDRILLPMLRAQMGQVCDARCPIGQSMQAGRCVPDVETTQNADARAASDVPLQMRFPAVAAPSDQFNPPVQPGADALVVDIPDPDLLAPPDPTPRRASRPRTNKNTDWIRQALGDSSF